MNQYLVHLASFWQVQQHLPLKLVSLSHISEVKRVKEIKWIILKKYTSLIQLHNCVLLFSALSDIKTNIYIIT